MEKALKISWNLKLSQVPRLQATKSKQNLINWLMRSLTKIGIEIPFELLDNTKCCCVPDKKVWKWIENVFPCLEHESQPCKNNVPQNFQLLRTLHHCMFLTWVECGPCKYTRTTSTYHETFSCFVQLCIMIVCCWLE